MKRRNKTIQIFALICIMLILFVPVVQSVSISNIVSAPTDKSALIEWTTDNASNSKVDYGNTTALGMVKTDSLLVENHSVMLLALDNATIYYFSVSSDNATDNNSNNFYAFTTLAQDTVPPYIDVELPEATTKTIISILGETEIGTIVELYINDMTNPQRAVYFANGLIEFYGVQLNPAQINTVKLIATDSAGNENTKTFSISVDVTPPVITLDKIPSFVTNFTTTLQGTISELADVTIVLNNNTIFNQYVNSFSLTASLQEGDNSLTVTAVDKAGHSTTLTKQIISDTTPPEITDIIPREDTFYYEGRGRDDIHGKTEPFARVRLFSSSRGNIFEFKETTTADASGNFKFGDVNFEAVGAYLQWDRVFETSFLFEFTAPKTLEEIFPEEQLSSYWDDEQVKQEERSVKFVVTVTDQAGLTTHEEFSYILGTCWSGELAFNIVPLLEYQTPTLLSPERLEEGNELISFILNLSYTGRAAEGKWRITDVDFDRACKQVESGNLADDPRYNISCKILPSSNTKDKNNKKTMWYVRYNLKSTDQFTDFTEDFWNDFAKRELIFPLKVRIDYKEKFIVRTKEEASKYGVEIGKEAESDTKFMEKCIPVAYYVDIPIDPRDVLPDWLLEGGMDLANETIEAINEILPKLEQVMEITGIGCIISFISRIIVKIFRNIRCKWESRLSGLIGSESECPSDEDDRKKLITEDLARDCPLCNSAWNAEAKVYTAYRWTCDRIFCHKTPARWTEGKSEAQIYEAELKSRSCATGDIAQVTPLRRVENCYKTYGPEGKDVVQITPEYKICYQYGNSLYVYDEAAPVDGVYTLDLYDKKRTGSLTGGIPKPIQLKAIQQEGSNTFAVARAETCTAVCNRMGQGFTAGCEKETDCIKPRSAGGEFEGILAGYASKEVSKKPGDIAPPNVVNCWVDEGAISENKQCCCYKDEGAITLPIQPTKDWEYREQQLFRDTKDPNIGTDYSKKIYLKERDQPACFGQNHLFDYARKGNEQIPLIDPFTQHISAFQCLCLTGIRNRLVLLRNIMQGVMNCFAQIKLTGEADAGVCKELFTKYICDMLYQVFVWFKNGCIPLPFGRGIRFGGLGSSADVEGGLESSSAAEGFKIGMSSVWDGMTTAGKDLKGEYGESTLSNFLNVGERAMARKICLAAFGFDIGLDMDTVLDMAYEAPFKTTAMGFFSRDYLTFNPDTEQATYEYRGAWSIFPGCKITDYSVELACINQYDKGTNKNIDCGAINNYEPNSNGCDCIDSTESFHARSYRFFSSTTTLEQGGFVDVDEQRIIDDTRRYDHAKITLRLADGYNAENCFPEEHQDGVFYFPIKDKTARDIVNCQIDQSTATIKCSRGLDWDEGGTARFETFSSDECDTNDGCYVLCYDPHAPAGTSKEDSLTSCDRVVFENGNQIKFKTKISGKDEQCLHVEVKTAIGKNVAQGSKTYFKKIGDDQLEDSYITKKKVLANTISSKDFEATAGGITATGSCSITHLPPDIESERATDTLRIQLNKGTKEGTWTLTSRTRLNILEEDLVDLTEIQLGAKQIIFKGYRFKINKILYRGECVITATKPTSSDTKEQKWKLNLKLYHPDKNGQCDQHAIDQIFGVGETTEITQTLRVMKDYKEEEKTPKQLTEEKLEIKIAKDVTFEDMEDIKNLLLQNDIKHNLASELEDITFDKITATDDTTIEDILDNLRESNRILYGVTSEGVVDIRSPIIDASAPELLDSSTLTV